MLFITVVYVMFGCWCIVRVLMKCSGVDALFVCWCIFWVLFVHCSSVYAMFWRWCNIPVWCNVRLLVQFSVLDALFGCWCKVLTGFVMFGCWCNARVFFIWIFYYIIFRMNYTLISTSSVVLIASRVLSILNSGYC